MYKCSFFYSLFFVTCGAIVVSNAWAKSADTDFDDSFYMTQICTSYINKNDHQYCDDGYVLKSETSETGETTETVLMESIGSYGWNHISINKIDADTYHMYVGCGNPCGANMLFGRGGKEQDFGREFNLDAKSRCSVGFNRDKRLWTASRFFSDKEIVLPSTYDPDTSAAYPKYDVEFDEKSRLIIKGYFDEEIVQTLPNPCAKRLK